MYAKHLLGWDLLSVVSGFDFSPQSVGLRRRLRTRMSFAFRVLLDLTSRRTINSGCLRLCMTLEHLGFLALHAAREQV